VDDQRKEELRRQILDLVAEYAEVAHGAKPFVPGETPVPVSGRVFGATEIQTLVDSALEFWLTSGRFNEAFQRKLAKFVGVRHVITTNSGSSANLLAVATLTSPKLGERALRPGDEIITVAAGFPTTVAPMLQYGIVPVFVDINIPTYNANPDLIEQAVTPKTRAIMLAHTLGNPFQLDAVMRVAKKHNLWVIEDCCDALGSEYRGRMVGTFGDIATVSFYPAHHITMGEGGAVMTNRVELKPLIESFRDWGRDCWCDPGKDNTCGKRFGWQVGDLPAGYDHKYTYSHVGYNLKITDMQAAVGFAQLERLPGFIADRKENFAELTKRFERLREFLVLPEATPESDPSWFGFPITVKADSPVDRLEVTKRLEEKKIATRLLFAGNLVRQPMMEGRAYRVAGELTNTDTVMNSTFWIGLYPGITSAMLDYVGEQMTAILTAKTSPSVARQR
jgi:CDP-4-dehydro-6-deoxyglucose reductase, E1